MSDRILRPKEERLESLIEMIKSLYEKFDVEDGIYLCYVTNPEDGTKKCIFFGHNTEATSDILFNLCVEGVYAIHIYGPCGEKEKFQKLTLNDQGEVQIA